MLGCCPRYTLWYADKHKTCHYALPYTPSHPTTPIALQGVSISKRKFCTLRDSIVRYKYSLFPDNSRPRQTSDHSSLTPFSSCQDIIKRAVPIIRLPGISLAGFPSKNGREAIPYKTEKALLSEPILTLLPTGI